MRRIVVHWLPFIAYLGLIFFLSTLPRPIPINVSIDASFLHPVEFFILTFLALRVLYAHGIKYPFTAAILAAALFGAIDEAIQSYTPGRTSSLVDVGLDFIGASLVLIFKNKRLSKIIDSKNKQS